MRRGNNEKSEIMTREWIVYAAKRIATFLPDDESEYTEILELSLKIKKERTQPCSSSSGPVGTSMVDNFSTKSAG